MFVAGVIAVTSLGALAYVASIAASGTGYEAQTLCSAIFISGRTEASVESAEFQGLHPLLQLVSHSIDREAREVRVSLLGLGAQKSIFRPGLGCTLTDLDATLPAPPAVLVQPRPASSDLIEAGPIQTPADVGIARLQAAVAEAFTEPNLRDLRRTRAVLVVQNGRILAERYARGFSKGMPLAGYSLTKTITGALVGILNGRGLIDVDEPVPMALWRTPGDPHAAITVGYLLHMTSGLAWSEDTHDPRSDVLLMAYHSRDTADYAAHRPMAHPAGHVFAYNSGATNIVARVLLTALRNNRDEYLALPRTALFDPAGMSSAVLAPDASGTLFGSTQAFATARDWARFGELYLHDGQRNGVQVLPHGWVHFCATPEPATQMAGYGALIWENRPRPGHPRDRPRPALPEDTLLMTGQFGQTIAVIPSYNAVIVRLGETHGGTIELDRERLIAGVLSALRQGPPDQMAAFGDMHSYRQPR